ncbi:hypothetical protein [Nostoc sp. PA-18-2419]|uniref:hypothetical protein n=1 Tax=Nostoc sp. PA-18-2419 TaxID=2575443 RepID=UPI0011088CA6|nr:hypothetical protein [Nostoc sp. PA-18-2419]
MASTFDIKGTSLDSFKIGIGGPTLNRDGSSIKINDSKIITTSDLGARQHLGYRSTRWYSTLQFTDGLSSGTGASTLNTLSYYPFYIPRSVTIDYFSFNQSATGTANTLFRLGVYSHNSSTFLPDTLLFQTSEITTSATGQKGETVNYTFNAGWYWSAVWSSQSIAISAETAADSLIYYLGLSSWSASATCFGYRQASTYSAGASLPSTALTTSLTDITASIPAFFFRVA